MAIPGIWLQILLHLLLIGRGFHQTQPINGRFKLTVGVHPALGRLQLPLQLSMMAAAAAVPIVMSPITARTVQVVKEIVVQIIVQGITIITIDPARMDFV